jgi:vancomycin resistance protein YoaR
VAKAERYVAVAGKPGRRVDVEASTRALVEALRQKQREPVPVIVQEIAPALGNLDVVAAEASVLTSSPFTLTLTTPDGVRIIPLEAALVRQWLELSAVRSSRGEPELVVRLNRGPAEEYLAGLAKELNRPAQDARLDFDPDKRRIVVLQPGQVGQSLDVEAGLTGIESALQRGEHVLPLEVRAMQPAVSSDLLPSVDGVELIAEGTTKFAGSSKERIQNIAVGVDKFRGVVVPAGAEFSFNKYVGAIDAANGFTEGLIIWGDRTAVGIGGGICQVSTTVFRAAFFGGFPITDRTAHGYVVSWYGEPGLDATIFTPDVDLRFRNDTNGPLFIKPEVDLKAGTLSFAFYGQRQPRMVEIVGPRISNMRPAPPPLYQEDKSLPKGTIKQVEWAKEGQDVVVIRKIRTADGVEREEKFESHYQPWRAVFLYGPGTALPPGATPNGQD